MTDLLLLVLLRLVLKNVELLALAVLDDISDNARALYIGSACCEALVTRQSENLIKGNCVTCCNLELFDE